MLFGKRVRRDRRSGRGSRPRWPARRRTPPNPGGPLKPLLAQARIEDPEVAVCLLHPARAKILEELRTPSSATEVAARLGVPAPRVNHHVRRLRSAGLVRRAGSRRVRNLPETLYLATARTYVVAESLTPGGAVRSAARADEGRRPLRNLVALGERLAGDALLLLDETARGEREISAFATRLDLAFPDARSRAAFVADLLEAARALQRKYGAADDAPPDERYRAVIACYPETRA